MDTSAAERVTFKLSPANRRVFQGLMVGMLVASISQTIVGPAMPRIVAELGGMDHYSWVATSAMLVSAITVPIVGKLSDLYGRRPFYIGGLIVFMAASLISGFAQDFWMLIVGRAIQGIGMGTVMPLSQTIVGDIIPPRQRGKYQGFMGTIFGVTSVAGPLAGGVITDALGWRWLFFITIPVGLLALFAIWRFMRLEHQQRKAKVDYAGIATLSLALITILLATSWGGTTYPWNSATILGLYGVGALSLVAFVFIERRVSEPVIPLSLFANSIFTFANLAGFCVAMVMFGAIIYIPVFAQGVMGVGAAQSGLILTPMMLGLIIMGILSGIVITRTGRYKELMLGGIVIVGIGVWLLIRLTAASDPLELTVAMIVIGVGLGLTLQQYTLVVQNCVARRDLGVATASTQFFRNVGSTVGIAIFGTIMTAGLTEAIKSHLPPAIAAKLPAGGVGAGSVLDPGALAKLPPVIAVAVRQGLADQLHLVFWAMLPLAVLTLIFTIGIRAIPLRDSTRGPEEAASELIDGLSQSNQSVRELVPGFGHGSVGKRTRERILGFQLDQLADESARPDRPLLRRAVTDLGSGDFERGQQLLARAALLLTSEDESVLDDSEKYAVEITRRSRAEGGIMSPELRKDLAVRVAGVERGDVLASVEKTVAERHEAVDILQLRAAVNELTAALMVDSAGDTRPEGRPEQPGDAGRRFTADPGAGI